MIILLYQALDKESPKFITDIQSIHYRIFALVWMFREKNHFRKSEIGFVIKRNRKFDLTGMQSTFAPIGSSTIFNPTIGENTRSTYIRFRLKKRKYISCSKSLISLSMTSECCGIYKYLINLKIFN